MGTGAAHAPEPTGKREYKPNRVWDKLLIVVGAIVVAVALLVVPGILNRGGQNPVAAAAEATSDAPGVRVSFTGTSQGPVRMSLRGSGVLDGEENRAWMEMSATGSNMAGTQPLTLEEIVDGGDLYIHSSELSAAFGGQARWLLMRAEALGDLLQSSASGGGMAASPTQQLDALEDASDQVAEVGPEQVNGVATTRYRALLDLGKLTDQLKSEVSGEFGDLIEKSMEQITSATVDVWIDGNGLIRRETSNSAMGSLGTFNLTMVFSDYGIRPDIQPPPSSEVFDATALMQRALDEISG